MNFYFGVIIYFILVLITVLIVFLLRKIGKINIENSKFFISSVILITLVIPFITYILVDISRENEIMQKDNILMYYGTIIGSCFTGVITSLGLYLTLKQTNEIQKENLTQIKIKNLNEIISDYKKLFLDIKKAIESINSILEEIDKSNLNYNEYFKITLIIDEIYFITSCKFTEKIIDKHENINSKCNKLNKYLMSAIKNKRNDNDIKQYILKNLIEINELLEKEKTLVTTKISFFYEEKYTFLDQLK